jgi:L,D-transpeptidase YcbB
MRRSLLASSAAALLLALCGSAQADRNQSASSTLAPPTKATARGLMFSKNADDATPMEPARAAPRVSPPDQGTGEAAPQPAARDEQPAAGGQAHPLDNTNPAIAAEDAAMADQLRDLIENRVSQFVHRAHDRAGILAFYQGRNFAPLWIENGKPAARMEQAAKFLRSVAADGLDPADYPAPDFGDTDPAKLAADELTLTNSIITFARHASIGRTAFSRISGAVWFDQKVPEAAEVLGKIAESRDVAATLDAFNPQVPAYKALKAELAAVHNGKDAAADPKAALEQEAKGHGMKHRSKAAKADEPKPRELSKAAKIDTIIANMERWRWMPHQLGATYVMVNVPDYTLKVVKDGKTVWQTKIVVGKPGTHATPLLTQTMKYITVNPTWNVPPSIIRNEYLPALAQDPNALARVGLRMGHNPDGSIRIYQPPGDRNALGRIRFNFPNRFLVYQHDTPDKYLFAKSERAYSHGCMRVQNPDEYAEVLLGVSQPEDRYTVTRIRSMYGANERSINFKHPIPVYITYQTAFVDDAGKPQSRADIYGLDKEINTVLRGDRRVADIPVARNYSSGSKPVMASGTNHRREASRSADGWDDDNGRPSWQSAFQPPPNRSRLW